MRTPTLCALLFPVAAIGQTTTGLKGDAMVVSNNPMGAKYVATFGGDGMTSVKGMATAMSGMGGKGVDFELKLMGLPMIGGPFSYHLHDKPVPSDGNCTGTMGHLDPYQRGTSPACDMTMPQTCEVGDLSGKHGKIDGSDVSKSFMDMYAALVPDTMAYFGNRSIVIHYANSTRLACANFTMSMSMPLSTSMGMPMSSPMSKPMSTAMGMPMSSSMGISMPKPMPTPMDMSMPKPMTTTMGMSMPMSKPTSKPMSKSTCMSKPMSKPMSTSMAMSMPMSSKTMSKPMSTLMSMTKPMAKPTSTPMSSMAMPMTI